MARQGYLMLFNEHDRLQATVKYNIQHPEDGPAFDVDVSVHRREATDGEEFTICYPLQLRITAEYVLFKYFVH